MSELEIKRRWGLRTARTWARLLSERTHIMVLGFDDVTELGAQERQRQPLCTQRPRQRTSPQRPGLGVAKVVIKQER
jgi:hypothetical protein